MWSAIITWLLNHKKIAVDSVLMLCVALSLIFGVITCKQNKKLSEGLEMAQNNIEAYQGVINASQQANNVLKLDLTELQQYNDVLLHRIDSVMEERDIKKKNVSTAATQTQSVLVNKSKGVRGQVIVNNKDSILTDSIKYNDLTKVFYTISKDSIDIKLDIRNTQYLYVYKKREYKNKKNFFQRLFTLDWKKVTKYKYEIVNTNDLIKEDSVRVIETIQK